MYRANFIRSQFADKKALEKKQEVAKKKVEKELLKQNKPDKPKVSDPIVAKKAKEWTVEDENLVKEMLNQHKSFEEIGVIAQRTPVAITFRHQMYVYELVMGGKTHEAVSKQLNLTIDKVKELCEKEELRLDVGKKNKEKWDANKVEKQEKKQIIEQEKEQKKSTPVVAKETNKTKKQQPIVLSDELSEIEELNNMKKVCMENNMNKEVEEMEILLKEKIRRRLENIKNNSQHNDQTKKNETEKNIKVVKKATILKDFDAEKELEKW